MPTTTQTGGLSSQTLEGADGANNTDIIYGDVNKLKGTTVGGADTIIGGDDGAINYLYGDAYSMEGKAKGGADKITGGANGSTNYIYGDAYSMQGKVKGGNDILFGGLDSTNIIYGDAYNMRDGVIGGDDKIIMDKSLSLIIENQIIDASNNPSVNRTFELSYITPTNSFFGDANKMDESFGGNDLIEIRNDVNSIFHDANLKSSSFSKINYNFSYGIDISNIKLIGDAVSIFDSKGGNDTITILNNLKNNIYNIKSFSEFQSKNSFVILDGFSILNNALVGDANFMENSKGGDDAIIFENFGFTNIGNVNFFSSHSASSKLELMSTYTIQDNILFGDGNIMSHSIGGNDVINIENNIYIFLNNLNLDARIGGASDSVIDIFSTFDILDNNIYGDAECINFGKGGDDTIFIRDLYLSKTFPLMMTATDNNGVAFRQSVESLNENNVLVGDAKVMHHSIGGNDAIFLGNYFEAFADELLIIIDNMAGGDFSFSISSSIKNNSLFGDAQIMNNSVGGDDLLNISVSIGGNDFFNFQIFDISLNNNNLFGDAETMNHSKGGDDALSMGFGILVPGFVNVPNLALTLDIKDNALYGDAKTMTHSQGGNDKLTGADGRGSVTYLYGDAQFTDGHSKAGDDVLTSGQGNDQMWGDFASVLNPVASSNDHDHEDDDEGDDEWDEHESDHDDDHHASNPYKYAGKDTFVFKENNGNDTIFDFQHGLDKIDLSAANIFSVDGLHIEQSAAHPSDTVIDLGGGNSITLVGVSNVVETDFVFAGISI